MKHVKGFISILLVGVLLSSCDKKFDKLLDNPSTASSSAADVDAFLNQAQLSANSVFSDLSNTDGAYSRMFALTSGDLYENSQSPQSFDAIWTNAYTGVIKHVDALVPLAIAQKKYQQAGIGQLLKAYTLSLLVDNFGDIPYSEADSGFANINPKTDGGQAIYNSLFTLIDSAISNLQNPGQDGSKTPATDLYFNGDADKWVTFGNTLKLKLYMQERLVNDVTSEVTDLETTNDLINASSQDFQFQYGTNQSSPDTRAPHYTDNYLGGGAGDYIANQFMYYVVVEKTGAVSSTDPRRRYYFYRQVGDYTTANAQTAQCTARDKPSWYLDDMTYCLPGGGYWGRDHGDNSGVGPDNYNRTAWGLYPAGGKFDASDFKALSSTGQGAGGKGINPIWLSSFTYFLESEAALTLNVTVNGTAESLLEKGIRASISKVIGFSNQIGYVGVPVASVPTQTAIDNYVTLVKGKYEAATTDDEKLNIIIKEYFIALWGNGVEAYNNLRRTGKPADLQYMVYTANPGTFPRSFFYPAMYVNNNANAPAQKTPGNAVQKVFWDNNPDDFIK